VSDLREHECPQALEHEVGQFSIGGQFLSPAGRWETVTDCTPRAHQSLVIHVWTDQTGPDYAWQLWRTDKLPYIPDRDAGGQMYVVVRESAHFIQACVSDSVRPFGSGHQLLFAQQIRGEGWKVTDRPNGQDPEQVVCASKATARTDVGRRARAHAKHLGLTVLTAAKAGVR
jgi:hypothetical protein